MLLKEEPIRRLASIIRHIKPDIILTHFPKEADMLVRDHAIAGQIVLHAIQYAGRVDPGDRNPPHRVAQVFFFGTGAATVRSGLWDAQGGYTNDVFVDIGDVIEKKLAALDCLASQGYGGAYARKRIETSDGAFGAAVRHGYAEGFIRMNAECHHYLPVTADALALARMSDSEYMARQSYRLPTE
jgi:LmbE family N-acetylglucosaminyl deacetylase